MNIICMLNKDTLYDKAVKEGVPFFQWHDWIEKLINKEVVSKILNKTAAVATAAVKGSSGKEEPKKSGTSAKDTLMKMQAAAKEKAKEKE
jgi:hypothetical protein